MNKVNVKRVLLGLIILLPMYSSFEVYSLMVGSIRDHAEVLTPVWVKAIKDFIFIFILFIYSLYKVRNNNGSGVRSLLLMILFLVGVSLLSLINNQSVILVLAGVRWFIPLLIIPVMVNELKNSDMKYLERMLLILFFLHLFLQFIQLFFATSWFGAGYFGLNARNPGFFIIPNTASIFVVCCAYASLFLKERGFGIHALFLISVVLTGSGGGFVALLILYLSNFLYKIRYWMVLISPTIIYFVFIILDFVISSVRTEGYVEKSLGTRVQIFIDVLDNNIYPSAFGSATNTGYMISPDVAFIADSTWASFVGNLGWLGLFILLSYFIVMIVISEIRKSKELLCLTAFVMVIAMTNIINEAYPINLLVAIYFAKALSNKPKIEVVPDESKRNYSSV